MISIQLVRDDVEGKSELVRESERRRCGHPNTVDDLMDLNARCRKANRAYDEARRKCNEMSKQIGAIVTKGENPEALRKEVRREKKRTAELQKKSKALEEERSICHSRIGNIVHATVPYGKDGGVEIGK
mmetsp:Transcript_23061/g.64784  ORF Transcript_23061/g.64784 Transcript_23061/m.64784 type:complete len:129 (+) Transcript_23061:98-484(+)